MDAMSPPVQRFSSRDARVSSLTMKRLLLVLAALAAPGAAQTVAPPPPPALVQSVPTATPPVPWDPVGPYITTGQDEPGYKTWYLADPAHPIQVKAFNDYLVAAEVGGVLPTWQLLRTATAWKDCGGQPFEVPPTTEWPHM